jgi:hypothetical protein
VDFERGAEIGMRVDGRELQLDAACGATRSQRRLQVFRSHELKPGPTDDARQRYPASFGSRQHARRRVAPLVHQ